jgi:hypothetical protein
MTGTQGAIYGKLYNDKIAQHIANGRQKELNPIDSQDIMLKNLLGRFGGSYSASDLATGDPYAGLGGDGTGGSGTGGGKGSKGLTESITGGGPRVINISGVKFADNINIHGCGGRSAMENTEDQLSEMFLRVLNSGAAAAG